MFTATPPGATLMILYLLKSN